MALSNLFPQNNWKADGLLGGMLAAEQYGYGLEQLQDEKRMRDLEEAMKANALERENLNKPVEASDRDLKLTTTNPLAKAKGAKDLSWVNSGNYNKEKETKLSTDQVQLRQKQYAQDALERGEWVLEGDTLFKPEENGYLGVNPEAWREWLSRKPKSVSYIQGDQPTPENIQRIRDAAKNASRNLDVVREIAKGEPRLEAARIERDTQREFLASEADENRANRTEIAKINADSRKKQTVNDSLQALANDTADEADIAAIELQQSKSQAKDDGSKISMVFGALEREAIAKSKGKPLTYQERVLMQQQALRATYPPNLLEMIERNEVRLYGAPKVPRLDGEAAAVARKVLPRAEPSGNMMVKPGAQARSNPFAALPPAGPLPFSTPPMSPGISTGQAVKTTSDGIPYVAGANGKGASDPAAAAALGDTTTPLANDEEWVILPSGGKYRRLKRKG